MNMEKGLAEFTDKELQTELEKRNQEKKKPKPVNDPDLSTVIRYCKQYIDDLHNDGRPPKDMEYYIFETAMQAVFGTDVWDWINERLE